MKVKKYVASTMPEAMNRIRKELGPEAVILNSKEIFHGGFLGFFKKRNIEVIAALDPQPQPPKKQETLKDTSRVNKTANVEDGTILNEIRHLKKIIEVQSSHRNNDYPDEYQVIFYHLINQEIDKDLAESIIDTILSKHDNLPEHTPTQASILDDTKAEIENRLSELPFEGLTYQKKIIQFVGPTGVGKTTTIAKVAAASMLKDNKKVALITADTYRIAAIEQLKTYSKILDIPIEVAYNIDDYKDAVEKFKSYDLILVDTAGRNFRDEKYVKELQNSIEFNASIETYLVLSMTAKSKDITEIHDQFRHLSISEVIFTKVDETRQYGSMLNIALKKNVGVAFMTNGQDVPDDIIEPSPKLISNYIVGEYSDA
ncbi:flagellar biosynthesis protein FlhF [Virgibacillus subterraneus]|uniref:Flagellar biosynthesis protein FlhF n=1 Tax=Virgibacillus subterraneus TaxID=621109 RepID=A0A1H9H601_9BACI|nr:flagellar biosynthesis protein FlhF [Virgibacillus subterraneus]SEQ57750.1 flagellar biosynthesis protein FlhF [Virgibacillus subterraneus]